MKKILIFTVLAIGIVACGTKEASKEAVVTPTVKVEVADLGISYNDPAVFVGSDFGNFINTLYKQGKFADMVKWTASGSVDKYGASNVAEFYKNKMKFGYEIGKPTSKTVSGDTITLNYEANIIATKRIIRIPVVIENDSCKLVISGLDKFPE